MLFRHTVNVNHEFTNHSALWHIVPACSRPFDVYPLVAAFNQIGGRPKAPESSDAGNLLFIKTLREWACKRT
jgi:hypothetical protein